MPETPERARAVASRPNRRRFLVAAALLAAAAPGGCAPYRAADIPVRPAHSLPNRQEKKRLVVAARALLDPGTGGRYFPPALWDADFFPVVVHLENRGGNSFEIRRRRLGVWLDRPASGDAARPTRLEPVPPAVVARRLSHAAGPAYLLAPLLVVPAIWAHRSIERYNRDLHDDFDRKSLPEYYRLEPGDGMLLGALFFPFPDADGADEPEDALKGAELRLDVRVEGSPVAATADDAGIDTEARVGESSTFVLPLAGEEG